MFVLAITLLVGFFLRMVGFNWDQGMHVHPDERMLIMVADKIHLFDQLNPNFFNYGTLPIYLLRGVAQITHTFFPTTLSLYDSLLYIGRALSLSADILVILMVYKLSLKLFKNKAVSILASIFYALAFFPIQNSHFFIVDTFLNLFILLTLYSLLRYVEKSTNLRLSLVALAFAAAVTTKITAIIFLPFTLCVILYHHRKKFRSGIAHVLIFSLWLLPFSFIFMPYAFINWQKFITDISLQVKLGSDPYVFPYTLQYVGTPPYLYYLKNIFFWGLGPITSVLSLVGLIGLISTIFTKRKLQSLPIIIFLLYFSYYFLFIGFSAVKFMRYMLPIYPYMAILAAYGLSLINKKTGGKLIVITLLIMTCTWTFMLNSIYLKEHTRITASKWVATNIPQGSVLAVEHWDDRLPMFYVDKYVFEELQLYNQPDDRTKWKTIKGQLSKSDYLIIASNRLYTPLQKLDDCKKYKSCYPIASKYYKDLFAERDEFKKIKEFSVKPTLKIFDTEYQIPDQSSDESFTVYDHPTIMIFKNMSKQAN